jgi:hypothetical protein
MPYHKLAPLSGMPHVALIENSRCEHDPIRTATLGRVTSPMMREHYRNQREQ